MSAQEKKFTDIELCQMLWETRGDNFSKFMSDAIRADIPDADLLLAFEATMAGKVAIFASFMKDKGRRQLLAQIMGRIHGYVLEGLDALDAAAQADRKDGGDA